MEKKMENEMETGIILDKLCRAQGLGFLRGPGDLVSRFSRAL